MGGLHEGVAGVCELLRGVAELAMEWRPIPELGQGSPAPADESSELAEAPAVEQGG